MRVTNKGASDCITLRQNFNANSMSGRWTGYSSAGIMPASARDEFQWHMHNAVSEGRELYVVYSYDTPIAWYDPFHRQWYYVDAKYSVTTSRHQSIVRMAIDMWDGEQWANDYVTVGA